MNTVHISVFRAHVFTAPTFSPTLSLTGPPPACRLCRLRHLLRQRTCQQPDVSPQDEQKSAKRQTNACWKRKSKEMWEWLDLGDRQHAHAQWFTVKARLPLRQASVNQEGMWLHLFVHITPVQVEAACLCVCVCVCVCVCGGGWSVRVYGEQHNNNKKIFIKSPLKKSFISSFTQKYINGTLSLK